jgi:serine/threonine protein phosphatase PrpC
MKVLVGVATDVGRVREGNEDSYLVDPPLYAVADGMGGARGGEVASQLALETIEELALAGEGTLAEQVTEANHAVFARSQEDRAVAGMGTTLTAVRVVDGVGHLAHVGDSRAYLLRGGAMRRLTDDHTLVNRMVKAGEITADEADVHPHRNVLTRVLGTEPEVKVDMQEVPLMGGDRLLLCSDGLFAMVNEEQIQAILEIEPDPQRVADRLVRAANRAGGVDNITVVVLDAEEDEPAAGGAGDDTGPQEDRGAFRRRRIVRWVGGALLAIAVVAAAWAVARGYVDRQWYVGVADGKVAVYQGVPAQPLGIHLSRVVVVTELDAATVTRLEYYKTLPEGISANDQADAESIVEQMRKDLRAANGTKAGGP